MSTVLGQGMRKGHPKRLKNHHARVSSICMRKTPSIFEGVTKAFTPSVYVGYFRVTRHDQLA